MLLHPKAWIKQIHIQGRGREVKPSKFSPNSWASAKLLQWFFNTQTPLSDTDGDTQHLTHLIPTELTQDLKLTPSGPILVWMLLVMSHSNEPQWGTCTAPSTHTQVQAELQTCTRLQKFPKPATVPLFTTEFPQLMLPWCIQYYICSWQAEGTLSRFYQPPSVQEITKLTISWDLGWSQQLLPAGAQGKSELSLLK